MPDIFGPVGEGGDFRLNAVVEHHDDHAIAMGFAEMADIAVEHWKRRGPNDLLFLPIVYNHRHALELILKAAIRETAARLRAEGDRDSALGRTALDEWLAGPKGAGHNLHALATRLDTWLGRLDVKTLPKDIHIVLMSLHQLDPKGDSFRYAMVRTKGGSFTPAPRPGLKTKKQAHVNVAAMHERFKAAFDLLSGGLMTELEVVREYQAEMAYQAGM